jgi:two-component system sensor histidine kinase YesM
VGVAYTQELLRSQDRIYKTYLLIAAAALILALVFALQLSRSIAGPIRRLMQTMRRVEDGDLHVRSQVSSRTELGQLSDSFDHMIAKTAELMDERLRSEEQKRKSEWKALQAQIQPHFLYNTLDSIIWMSHAGRNAEVVEMTSALALLLRSSIGDGSDTNTLKKEIAHVRSYLTIQKMRYNEKLRYEIDLDPQTEDCLLPKLILQPLVENAIYHGIKVKQQGGTVRIESLLEEDRLLITVEDDGVGMTPEQLETILDKKESDAESTKIGVYNVNERLQLFFGPDAVMKYYSTPGVRTMVMLVLPIVRGKEEDSHAED